MKITIPFKAFFAGSIAAFIGFASSFAILIQGLGNVGANKAEIASGLMMVSVSMGLCAIFLGLKYRMPISTAWSTPGAAFLVTLTPLEGGFSAAVGAFIISAILIILTGLWKPLGRVISAIPNSLASAMLAGVLLPLCLAPFEAMMQLPLLGFPVVLTWVIMSRFSRLFAVPVALLVACILILRTTDFNHFTNDIIWSLPVFIEPSFTLSALFGIAIPLYIITMASQNITGITVLSSYGYKPSPGRIFSWTGVFSLLCAPFGSHAVNLAAITAAICANEDAHPDPKKRFWASNTCGVVHVFFGLTSAVAVAFISISPPIIISAVAGLALFGAMSSSLSSAMSDTDNRESALITFLVSVSSISFFGISGAFWGLVAGSVMYLINNRKKAKEKTSIIFNQTTDREVS